MLLLLLSVTVRTNELNVDQRRYQATDGLIPTLFDMIYLLTAIGL